MSACPICDDLSPKRVKNIDRHLLAGKKSLSKIAKHYHVEEEALQRHLQCIENVPVEDEELERNQRLLTVMVNQFQQDINAGRHYEFDPENGIDGRGVINHMLATLREHRETVSARAKLRSPDVLYQDLRETVIDPLITAITVILIKEAKCLRDDLFDVTKELPQAHPRIKQAVDEMLTRSADRFASEALGDIREKVSAVVSPKRKRPTQQDSQH
jgi:hypothetical protein